MTGYGNGDIHVQRVTFDNLERLNRMREEIGLLPRNREDFHEGGWWSWIVADQRFRRDIGFVTVIPCRDGERELGFALIPDARGRGVFSAVLPLFVRTL